jgi:hypothetical protein
MPRSFSGDGLRSKTEVAGRNEVLCKILSHNLCVNISAMYELGIQPVFAARAAFSCVDDKICGIHEPPILEYGLPRKKASTLSLVARCAAGTVAGLLAAIFLVGGFMDGMEGMGWGHFVIGVVIFAITFFILRPVPFIRRPKQDSN